MKKLILIRHCQAEGKHRDSALTNLGVNQAHRLTEYFESASITPSVLLTSPFMAAVETIAPYARKNGLTIITDTRLQEQVLSDQPVDDYIDVVKSSFHNPNYKLPGGESACDVVQRFKAVVDEYSKADECIVIVSHGHLLAHYLHEINPEYDFKDWQVLKNPDVFIIEDDGLSRHIKHVW